MVLYCSVTNQSITVHMLIVKCTVLHAQIAGRSVPTGSTERSTERILEAIGSKCFLMTCRRAAQKGHYTTVGRFTTLHTELQVLM